MQIKAHRNLNSPKGRIDWSMTPLEGSHKGKVLGYAAWISLKDVSFRVQPKGVQRIKERGVRSVVAWTVGEMDDSAIREFRYPVNSYTLATGDAPSPAPLDGWVQIRFDALLGDLHFKTATSGKFVTHAERVILTDTGACFALHPIFANTHLYQSSGDLL